ncbi:MAG: hypothetical protein ABIG46_06195 [Candidatus Omnitrophota bacterium]
MNKIKKIAKSIWEICFDVDKNITGLSKEDSLLWSDTNSIRHAHTIRTILDYIDRNNKSSLNILNASGLGCGHSDFSIVSYLRKNTHIDIKWKSLDSPDSTFLANNLFRDYIERLKIELDLIDFSKINGSDEFKGPDYDIVLFTEIAEHLDHSSLLEILIAIRKKIKEGGILIITTPNLLRLENRMRMLLGNADGPYWGDGRENLEKGLYGHIVNYDVKRLRRLLIDTGFKAVSVYTFTPGRGASQKTLLRYIFYKIIDVLSFFAKYFKAEIFMVAVKSDAVKIPPKM